MIIYIVNHNVKSYRLTLKLSVKVER